MPLDCNYSLVDLVEHCYYCIENLVNVSTKASTVHLLVISNIALESIMDYVILRIIYNVHLTKSGGVILFI